MWTGAKAKFHWAIVESACRQHVWLPGHAMHTKLTVRLLQRPKQKWSEQDNSYLWVVRRKVLKGEEVWCRDFCWDTGAHWSGCRSWRGTKGNWMEMDPAWVHGRLWPWPWTYSWRSRWEGGKQKHVRRLLWKLIWQGLRWALGHWVPQLHAILSLLRQDY